MKKIDLKKYLNKIKEMDRKQIITGIVVILVIIAIIILAVLNINKGKKVAGSFEKNLKLSCKSETGNITLIYNNKDVINYESTDMTYDIEGQKKRIEKIGMEKYLDEFEMWFEINNKGTCEKSK